MIAPREALAIMNRPDGLDEFEAVVDRALTVAAKRRAWPFPVSFVREHAALAETIVTNYRAVGWCVQIVDSQRADEDPFLQFERPTP